MNDSSSMLHRHNYYRATNYKLMITGLSITRHYVKTAQSIAIIILLSLSASPANAQQAWREAVRGDWKSHRATLPPFCAANVKHRAPFNGPNFLPDMTWGNHLCGALVKIPICRTYPQPSRNECLSHFTEGYTYWISHAKNPNFGMLPYLHTGLGELYIEMGNKGGAIQEFHKAIAKNPKYLKAYKAMIDALISIDDLDGAQQYLDKAMSIKQHKAFKRRQVKIDKLRQQK